MKTLLENFCFCLDKCIYLYYYWIIYFKVIIKNDFNKNRYTGIKNSGFFQEKVDKISNFFFAFTGLWKISNSMLFC